MSEYIADRDPDRCPMHPGELLREEILPALGLNISAAAEALNVTRQTLHRILAETSSVSPEMALRLGKFCGNDPLLWVRMQLAYDLWHAKRKIAAELDAIKPARAA